MQINLSSIIPFSMFLVRRSKQLKHERASSNVMINKYYSLEQSGHGAFPGLSFTSPIGNPDLKAFRPYTDPSEEHM